MQPAQVFQAVEQLLATVPPDTLADRVPDEHIQWVSRTIAVLSRWRPASNGWFTQLAGTARSSTAYVRWGSMKVLRDTLFDAREDLRLTLEPASLIVGEGQRFDYFDFLRQRIERAREDAFFVDPYLDAGFVAHYLPHVANGVLARLLTSDSKLKTLLPAVQLFVQQHDAQIQVRTTQGLHDRFLFVDRVACFFSGASFKDGAVNAPALVHQVLDGAETLYQTYDRMWEQGSVQV